MKFLKTVPVCLAALAAFALVSCSTAQGTRQDYFGYRNSLPAPAQEEGTAQQGQQGWQNPYAQTAPATQIAYIPVVMPWYDQVTFGGWYGRRYWSTWDYWSPSVYAWNPWNSWSSWGWGPSIGLTWGSPWGWNSPFAFGSAWYSPAYGFNPYWGYSGYRPYYGGGWGGTTIVNVYNDVAARQTPIRDFGIQRPYANSSANNSATYIGSYDGGGANGGRYRNGVGNSANNTNVSSSPAGWTSSNGLGFSKGGEFQQSATSGGKTRGWSGNEIFGGSSAPSRSSGNGYNNSWGGSSGSSKGSWGGGFNSGSSGGGFNSGGFGGSKGGSFNSGGGSSGTHSSGSSGRSSGGGRIR
jgi:hypothetical protein